MSVSATNSKAVKQLRSLARNADSQLVKAIDSTKGYSFLDRRYYIFGVEKEFSDVDSLSALASSWTKLFRDGEGKKQKHVSADRFAAMQLLPKNEKRAEFAAMAVRLTQIKMTTRMIKRETEFVHSLETSDQLFQSLVGQVEWFSKNSLGNKQVAASFKTSLELLAEFIDTFDMQSRNIRVENGNVLMSTSDILRFHLKRSIDNVNVIMTAHANDFTHWKSSIKAEATGVVNTFKFTREIFHLLSMIDHYFWGTSPEEKAFNTALLVTADYETKDKAYYDSVRARMRDFTHLVKILKLDELGALVDHMIGRNEAVIRNVASLAS